jgi:hypothetical protein
MTLMGSTDYDRLIASLTGPQRDAAAAVMAVFRQFGLESLASKIVQYVRDGYAPDTVSLLLQDTPEYQQRFSANAARIKAGLPALSPAEYIATERAYMQVLSKWGVPAGFYDSASDLQKFLELDLSPVELDSRAQNAMEFINRADPQQKAFFEQYYTKGDMVAFALDPKRAEPLVGKAFRASEVGGAAAAQGLGISQLTAERLAGQGVTAAQARQGFGLVASDKPAASALSAIYAGTEDAVTEEDLIASIFESDAESTKKVKKLASRERATFGGSSGINTTSLQDG